MKRHKARYESAIDGPAEIGVTLETYMAHVISGTREYTPEFLAWLRRREALARREDAR